MVNVPKVTPLAFPADDRESATVLAVVVVVESGVM
jgi:hypothetical protein